MESILHVPPLRWWEKIADVLMIPIMFLIAVLSGALNESLQRTHRWNNKKLKKSDVEHLRREMMVECCGVDAKQRGIVRFHIPFLGGWRQYTVLAPRAYVGDWHIGWIADDVIGVSRIPNDRSARLLLGPKKTLFFGVSPEGKQLKLRVLGEGEIGDGGEHKRVPLF